MKKINTKRFFFRLILMTGVICSSLYFANAQTAATAKPAAAKPAVAKAPAVKGVTAIIDTFFKKYKDDGTSPAIDYLFATNKLFTDSVQLNVLKSKGINS